MAADSAQPRNPLRIPRPSPALWVGFEHKTRGGRERKGRIKGRRERELGIRFNTNKNFYYLPSIPGRNMLNQLDEIMKIHAKN